jgi:transcriptional regulator with XRE-family HTH domain
VGRSEDLAKLKELLIKQPPATRSGVVCLVGGSLQKARRRKELTQERLAELSGYSLRLVKKAEAGEPIRGQTAIDISIVLNKPLEELTARSGQAVAVQTLILMRGLPGVGKTTITAAIAHDGEIRRGFPDGVLWTALGQSPNTLSELAAWGRSLGIIDVDQETDKKYARARLAALLSDKRMLLIIDDAWRTEDALAMMVGGPQCSILVTTRITEVADALAPAEEDIYVLKVLSDEESVELLERLASKVVSQHRKESLELVQALERLPLALQVAGRLLREVARNDWGVRELLKELSDTTRLLREKAPGDMASETTPTVRALFKKSTDVLGEEARKCFAYLAPYAPKPATFDIKAMTASWKKIAVEPAQMAQLLTARGLLEPIGGGRFWMHAMLVAHARSLLSRPVAKSRTEGGA